MGESNQLKVATSEMEQLISEMPENTQVGAQIRTIARGRFKLKEIQNQLSKMSSKPDALKKLFGPDFGAIKNLKRPRLNKID